MLPNIDVGEQSVSLLHFAPELIVCVSIVLLLVLRLFKAFDKVHLGTMALIFTLLALAWSVGQWTGASIDGGSALGGQLSIQSPGDPTQPPITLFGGLLAFDYLAVFVRVFLYSFVALVIWLTLLTGIPDREDSADFYVLLLGATLGMAIMGMATHLLMVFIAIEMASLPSYALAGFLKGKRQSSEAALKYVVYGGGASGVMLYGISLLAGRFGTGYLPDIAVGLVHALSTPGQGPDGVLIMGTLFVLVGIAFKLAAVPFHFWCPDVFEGAAAEVAGFLSVASKAAALALLARFTLLLGGMDSLANGPGIADAPWMDLVRYLIPVLAFLAALTTTFGNLAAYAQTNLKRLLAYSTIAHAGYMMMGLCTLSKVGTESVCFYLVAYLFMNLGAFAVVAFLRNQTGSEDLADFRGLVRRSPVMVLTLAVFLLSLLGMPPLAGFPAKFEIFRALWVEGQNFYDAGHPGLGATLIGLLVVGGLNTVLSAFYYLKVLKVMILDRRAEDLEGTEPPPLREPVGATSFATILALTVLVLGVLWGPLDAATRKTAAHLREAPGKTSALRPPTGAPKMGGPGGGAAPKGKGKGKGKAGAKAKAKAKGKGQQAPQE